MYKGKRTCKILKEIRAQIAAENDIEFVTSECKHQGDCAGTCPKCEAEVRYLERELEKRIKLGKAVTVAGLAAAITATSISATSCDAFRPTGGEPSEYFTDALDGDKAPPEYAESVGEIVEPDEDVMATEQIEEFLAVQLPFAPSDFVRESDRAIYTALKTTLAESQCPEEDERYVFLLHWDDKLKNSRQTDDGITDTYQISYHLDENVWEETYEYLRLTFSPSGALLAAAYEKTKSEYMLSGDMAYIPEIYQPDDAQEFSKKKELLAAMEDFFSRNKASDEDERKLTRARWNEYYAYSHGETDYYAMDNENSQILDEATGEWLTQESKAFYLALTFDADGALVDAVVTPIDTVAIEKP